MTSPCDTFNRDDQRKPSCFDSLSAEVVATILEFVSIKPVVLFSTLRRTSKLFNQAVALTFERRFFQKAERSSSSSCGTFPSMRSSALSAVSLHFTSHAVRQLRCFLTMLPLVSEACLHAVETLSFPGSLDLPELLTLTRALPNTKHLQIRGGNAKLSNDHAAVLFDNLPHLQSLQLDDMDLLDPRAREGLLSDMPVHHVHRLHLAGAYTLSLGMKKSPFRLSSLALPLLEALTWLHLDNLKFVEGESLGLLSNCKRLEGLALVSLAMGRDFFQNWNEVPSLRVLNMTNNTLVGPLPGAADFEHFFSLNQSLTSLTMDQRSFPPCWGTAVAQHCLGLRQLRLDDDRLPLATYAALRSRLTQLDTVHVEVETDALLEARLVALSGFKNVEALYLRVSTEMSYLSIGRGFKFPQLTILLAFLNISADEVASLIEGSPLLRQISISVWNAKVIETIGNNCPALNSLSIDGSGEGPTALDLSQVFQRCRKLTALTLSSIDMEPDVLLGLVAHRVPLSSLTVSNVKILQPLEIRNFLLNAPQVFSRLTCHLTDTSSVEMILRTLCACPHLDIRWLSLGYLKDIRAVTAKWKPQLKAVFPNLVTS
jgi:hypothetical protein